MNHLTQNQTAWQILAIVGVALMIAEIFINGFVLLPIGLGFLFTALIAVFVAQWPILLAVLAGSQAVIFWIFQRHLKKLHAQTRAYTNAEGMLGSECVVTERIARGQSGYVKLYGDRWEARSYSEEALEAGTRVVITKIEGNKVLVEPIN